MHGEHMQKRCWSGYGEREGHIKAFTSHLPTVRSTSPPASSLINMPSITTEPAAPRPSANMPASTTVPDVPRLLVLEYGTRQVLVQKSTGYNQLQESIRCHFPEIPNGHRLSFHTKDLPISNGSSVAVSPDVWPMVIPILDRITIPHLDRETRLVSFEVKPSANVGALKPSIRDAEGIPVDNQRFLFKGKWVEDSQTMQELGVNYGPEWFDTYEEFTGGSRASGNQQGNRWSQIGFQSIGASWV
ncbi:hypothetical protein NMY22_g6774 [Coprinellus aureogranulatus]|nr:hypothetical protein NMY22_g6774 [Coprinellus aureogranulatus]